MNVLTQLDAPNAQAPETRAAAATYLRRTGNADLLPVLGLVVPAQAAARVPSARRRGAASPGVAERCPTCHQEIDRRPKCPACGKPYSPGYRVCRRAPCSAGPKARGVKR